MISQALPVLITHPPVIVITLVAAFAAKAAPPAAAGLMGAWGLLCHVPGFSRSLTCGVAVPLLSRRWGDARFLLRVLQK